MGGAHLEEGKEPLSLMGSLLFSGQRFRGACGGPPVQDLAGSGEVAPVHKIRERVGGRLRSTSA